MKFTPQQLFFFFVFSISGGGMVVMVVSWCVTGADGLGVPELNRVGGVLWICAAASKAVRGTEMEDGSLLCNSR